MQGKISVLQHRVNPMIEGSQTLEERLNELRLGGYTIISVYPLANEGRLSSAHELVVAEPVSMADFNIINKAGKEFHKKEVA